MSADSTGSQIAFPEQALATASAIAQREIGDLILFSRIQAFLLGEPFKDEYAEQLQATQLGKTALLLLRVENPSMVITQEQASSAMSAFYDESAKALNDLTGSETSADEIRKASEPEVQKVTEAAGLGAESSVENFAKLYEAAKVLAEERGLNVATVYSDDELYYEACSRAYTLEEDVDEAISFVNAITSDSFMNQGVRLLTQILPEEMVASMSQEMIDQMSAAMQLDPDMQRHADTLAKASQEAGRQRYLVYLIKTFGAEAVKRIPEEKQGQLFPQMDLAPEVATVISTIRA